MSQVIRAVVEWAFHSWADLARLEAFVYSTNPASGRVLAKAGFSLEGTQRAAVFKLGQLIDQNMWAIVRPDLRTLSRMAGQTTC